MEDTKNKKLIAYHEVGHAIVGSVLENHDEVEKITLIPRGGAKGLTWFTPEEDQTSFSFSIISSNYYNIRWSSSRTSCIW
jgi:cell division protease FtsH